MIVKSQLSGEKTVSGNQGTMTMDAIDSGSKELKTRNHLSDIRNQNKNRTRKVP
jgi:hypothetical protein